MLKSRVQETVDCYLKKGYTCSQAIAVTYADLLGLDPIVCFRGMEAFGSGMGSKAGTCGAISGAVYLAGFVKSTGELDDDKTNKSKKESYALSKKILDAFQEKNKTVTCADMKEPKSELFRPCPKCIADAAIIVEEIIFPGQFEKSDFYTGEED